MFLSLLKKVQFKRVKLKNDILPLSPIGPIFPECPMSPLSPTSPGIPGEKHKHKCLCNVVYKV